MTEVQQRAAVNKWIVTATVLTGTIMAVLDTAIINVALPSMTGTFGATVEEITWVVTGYILAQVILMPITGMLSQRFGRKNFLLMSVAAFTLASMLCGLARSLPLMIIFRVLQGAGGGALITIPQAILRETFPAEEQGMAMGIYGMGVVLAPAFGPTLGGWLTDHYSWPWIFYINVPVGILNVLLVSKFIHDPPYLRREKGRIDWEGLALLTIGLGSLQLMLEQGQRNDWFESSRIVLLLTIALIGLALFVWRELIAKNPAVELHVLNDQSFTSATLLGGVLGMGLLGSIFLLPLFLQQLLGYDAMTSGMAMMPRSLAMAVVMPVGGRFYNRFGPKVFVGVGLAISAASFWDLSHLTTRVGVWDIFWPQLWQGVGFSLIFLALSTAALATIPKPLMTQASGLYNVVRQIFGSIGIAIAASQLTRGIQSYHERIRGDISSYDPVANNFVRNATAAMMRNGVDPATAKLRALKLLDLSIFREAAVTAYNHIFALVTILFCLAIPFVAFLRTPQGKVDHEIAVE
ncbi:MAG TPA: DHA2 family efflux MFS transporter permease subunit [Longimicrobiales bacterium]|nr:DHA2 family efflux MFS transporter permease subunit [Longimicrobiales bacterium]